MMADIFFGVSMRRSRAKMGVAQRPALLGLLNAYALAAGAAGVGALALVPSANGEVIYTPVHVVLTGRREFYYLDVNNDGFADFSIGLFNSSNFGVLSGFAALPNGFEVNTRSNVWPLALKARAPIGPEQRFYGCSGSCNYIVLASVGSRSSVGKWDNVTNRYLGLEFAVGQDLYYGWARMSVKVSREKHEIEAVVTGYAYENTPYHGIHAGQTSGTFDAPHYATTSLASDPSDVSESERQPGSLGSLALGASEGKSFR